MGKLIYQQFWVLLLSVLGCLACPALTLLAVFRFVTSDWWWFKTRVGVPAEAETHPATAFGIISCFLFWGCLASKNTSSYPFVVVLAVHWEHVLPPGGQSWSLQWRRVFGRVWVRRCEDRYDFKQCFFGRICRRSGWGWCRVRFGLKIWGDTSDLMRELGSLPEQKHTQLLLNDFSESQRPKRFGQKEKSYNLKQELGSAQ